MRRHWAYFKYVVRHKFFVLLAGLKLGVPLWNLIFHDWTKFTRAEWGPYARTFYTPKGKPQYKESPEFAAAWNHHQKANRHHYQYWFILWDRGETDCLPMPDKDRREMLADWMGAGRALGKPDTAAWYRNNYHKIKLHPATRAWVDDQLLPPDDPLRHSEVTGKWIDTALASRRGVKTYPWSDSLQQNPDIKFWQMRFTTEWNPGDDHANIVPAPLKYEHIGVDVAKGPDETVVQVPRPLIEVLGDVSHDIWTHWMRWQFSVCQPGEDGALIIPKEKVERWQRQIDTPYSQLSDGEKNSDREQGEKIIHAMLVHQFDITYRGPTNTGRT